MSNLRAWVVRRSVTRGLAELLAGDSPAWIRGYNAGFDEAWGQRESEVDELRRLLFIAFAGTTIPADDPLTAEIAAAIGDE